MATKSLTLQRETIENLEVPVFSTVDPTDWPVSFAFPLLSERPSVFTAGFWLSTAVGAGREFESLAVTPTIGATGATIELAAGTYGVYIKIAGDTETPVLYAGQITVK